MTTSELVAALLALNAADKDGYFDRETVHRQADALLLTHINSDQVSSAFANLPKWYA